MKPLIAIALTTAPLLLSPASSAFAQQATASSGLPKSGATSVTSDPTSPDPFYVAQNRLPDAQSTYTTRTSIVPHPGAVEDAVVVFSSDHAAKTQADLQEDLAVMSHILDKAVQQKVGSEHHRATAMGINVLFAPGASAFRSLYLDGYGVLFTLQVDFPLLPPPKETEAAKEKTPVDSTWDEARQELYGTGPQRRGAVEPAERYSPEKVEALKTALIDTLKNATNVRDLKPDEWVTVCVFGGGNGGVAVARTRSVNGDGAVAGDVPNVMWVEHKGPMRQGTVLTLRARKSDVDAFAKGESTPEDFRKKVSITSYVGGIRHGDAVGGFSFGGASGGYGGYGGYGSSVNLLGPDTTAEER